MRKIGHQRLRRGFSRNQTASAPFLSFLGIFAVLLFFGSAPRAADQDQFLVQELSIDGWMLASLVGDFDGDGLRDVALIY